MSEFDDFAAANAGALIEQFSERQALTIKPKSGNPFTVDAIFGLIRGAELFTDTETTKVLSAAVSVLRSDFAAHGVFEMPLMARIDAYGLPNWSIRISESEWGAVWVKIGLERETLAREYQAQRNAAV